jgi:hypothetical protein
MLYFPYLSNFLLRLLLSQQVSAVLDVSFVFLNFTLYVHCPLRFLLRTLFHARLSEYLSEREEEREEEMEEREEEMEESGGGRSEEE